MMKVKNGDLDKLGLLYERYNRPLFSFFYRMSKEAELCEDLVHSVFERMLKYRDTYTGEGKFTTWMFSIARNAHIDHYRKQKREGISIQIDEERLFTDNSDIDNDVNKVIANETEKRDLLEKALAKLDEDKREVVILSRYEGLKYKEIAQILDTSEGAIKVKMFRAMKDLKNLVNTINQDY